jgi:AraC-like DNA-binding protein
LVLRLPRSSLSPLLRHVDDAVLRPIPHGTGALRLLSHYAKGLLDEPALAVPETRQLVSIQLCDLIAVTIGATRDAAAVAADRGIRAARLHAIKTDIEARLDDPDLSPSAVARRQRISESYIRTLFAGDGTSLSDFVLHRRLVRAHRMLAYGPRDERSIASIAFVCGFGDLSYFNRTFKRLYGATPSDVRSAPIGGGVPSR